MNHKKFRRLTKSRIMITKHWRVRQAKIRRAVISSSRAAHASAFTTVLVYPAHLS